MKKGYITLISVLVVGAVGVAITVSLLFFGLNSSISSFNLEQSNQAKALVNACTEEALQQIRDSNSFSGVGNLNLGQGTCSYTIVNNGGENRTITSTGIVGTMYRRIEVLINVINPQISITSWQEIADFVP